jgi:hypothetical protein
VLTEEVSSIGYLVLRCVRTYVEAVTWENLDVHTTETIKQGRKAVEHFGACMRVRFYQMILSFIINN